VGTAQSVPLFDCSCSEKKFPDIQSSPLIQLLYVACHSPTKPYCEHCLFAEPLHCVPHADDEVLLFSPSESVSAPGWTSPGLSASPHWLSAPAPTILADLASAYQCLSRTGAPKTGPDVWMHFNKCKVEGDVAANKMLPGCGSKHCSMVILAFD